MTLFPRLGRIASIEAETATTAGVASPGPNFTAVLRQRLEGMGLQGVPDASIATLERRFWAKVDKHDQTSEDSTPCWMWNGATSPQGYGHFNLSKKTSTTAHRVSYLLSIGVIPEGLHLDHLCRNRGCVNPAHLEPVSPRENLLRGEGVAAVNAAKTHCHKGHEFTSENTQVVPHSSRDHGTKRICLICQRERRTRQAARRAGATLKHSRLEVAS
jgi:hypothetical protein